MAYHCFVVKTGVPEEAICALVFRLAIFPFKGLENKNGLFRLLYKRLWLFIFNGVLKETGDWGVMTKRLCALAKVQSSCEVLFLWFNHAYMISCIFQTILSYISAMLLAITFFYRWRWRWEQRAWDSCFRWLKSFRVIVQRNSLAVFSMDALINFATVHVSWEVVKTQLAILSIGQYCRLFLPGIFHGQISKQLFG